MSTSPNEVGGQTFELESNKGKVPQSIISENRAQINDPSMISVSFKNNNIFEYLPNQNQKIAPGGLAGYVNNVQDNNKAIAPFNHQPQISLMPRQN